jgi:hypothetical protein
MPTLTHWCATVDALHCTLLFWCCAQLHALGMPAGHFSHIMFDEAGHAEEPLALCALAGGPASSTEAIHSIPFAPVRGITTINNVTAAPSREHDAPASFEWYVLPSVCHLHCRSACTCANERV